MLAACILEVLANVSQILGLVGVIVALVALWFARSQLIQANAQLIKTKKATHGQMILAIDQALLEYNDIRFEAGREDWKPPPNDDKERSKLRHRIKQYMGVWERVEDLLADGSIEESTVNKLYRERVYSLMRNDVVRDYLIDKPDDWRDFLKLATRFAESDSTEPDSKNMKRWVDEVEAEREAKRASSASASPPPPAVPPGAGGTTPAAAT
jgi:hypothetical protein